LVRESEANTKPSSTLIARQYVMARYEFRLKLC